MTDKMLVKTFLALIMFTPLAWVLIAGFIKQSCEFLYNEESEYHWQTAGLFIFALWGVAILFL